MRAACVSEVRVYTPAGKTTSAKSRSDASMAVPPSGAPTISERELGEAADNPNDAYPPKKQTTSVWGPGVARRPPPRRALPAGRMFIQIRRMRPHSAVFLAPMLARSAEGGGATDPAHWQGRWGDPVGNPKSVSATLKSSFCTQHPQILCPGRPNPAVFSGTPPFGLWGRVSDPCVRTSIESARSRPPCRNLDGQHPQHPHHAFPKSLAV